eukprot:gnl/TRDRNA2_/TRDRNA2_79532_c0_seq3.p1 gnl/TRDRNA2_/TRDRNA2_79532_c0~~gnl/TRDRNA2_/TRDRNA2_79532_c0_seq3.p1  ORF type:complete len:273 (+),score=30.46 gnl/TRDRNA2_/TRDRNA2_79532_c0_seq3:135-953(+)
MMQMSLFALFIHLCAIFIGTTTARRASFRNPKGKMLQIARQPCDCCESCPNKCQTTDDCGDAPSPPSPSEESNILQASSPSPASDSCTPQCTWKCDSPTCDQVCKPDCQQPRCQTRCSKADTSGCTMKCNEPRCMVVCPDRPCAGEECPKCTTKCTQPECRLECLSPQPCHTVCAQPQCNWDCRKPDHCPTPKCSLVCEEPRACSNTKFTGSTEMPALGSGEQIVSSFAASEPTLTPPPGAKASDFSSSMPERTEMVVLRDSLAASESQPRV